MPAPRTKPWQAPWFKWIVLSTVCWFCACPSSLVLAAAITFATSYPFQAIQISAPLSLGLFLGLTGAICGTIGGRIQYHLGAYHLASAQRWVAVTALGWSIGAIAATPLIRSAEHTTRLMLLLPFTGLGAGIGQWLLIRHTLKRSWWWIVVTTLAGVVAGVCSVLIYVWWLQGIDAAIAADHDAEDGAYISDIVGGLVAAACAGVLFGGISGVALAYIRETVGQVFQEQAGSPQAESSSCKGLIIRSLAKPTCGPTRAW
jgi:hypothetical protein